MSTLFDPISVAGLKLRNRTVMAPMTRRHSPGGVPGADVAAYYRRRGEGGVALIMTEGLAVDDRVSVESTDIPNLFDPVAIAAWRQITAEVQATGATFVPQLWHVGGFVSTVANPTHPSIQAVSPSGVYVPGKPYGAPASQADIDQIIDAYAASAQSAFEIGCDGIEIHGAHGYLIDQFFWDQTNLRTDGYGGDMVARTRFACEIIAECRRRTSPLFPIFFRFSQWKLQDYPARLFITPDDLARFLEPLTQAGVDVFDCSTRRFWIPEFEGSDLNLAGWTQKLSGKPTMTVGSVGLDNDVVASLRASETAGVADLSQLDRMLERGDFDLVGIGRALLGDPHWVEKVKARDFAALKPFTPADLQVLS